MLPGIDDGRFRTLWADPPWLERGGGKIKRGADRHYGLLPTREIPKVMKGARDEAGQPLWLPASDAHLYLAVTNNFLPAGLWVMAELGFRFVTNLAWTKMTQGTELDDVELEELRTRQGPGQYFRGEHELVLFGVRGKGLAPSVCTDRRDLGTAILAKHVIGFDGKRVHSAKPPAIYERIEARSKGPYLELFARSLRPGWVSWGNDPKVLRPGPQPGLPGVE
jgi:N6-adenosine-specific RNA methylase IME4